jgi:hypothetical protein
MCRAARDRPAEGAPKDGYREPGRGACRRLRAIDAVFRLPGRSLGGPAHPRRSCTISDWPPSAHGTVAPPQATSKTRAPPRPVAVRHSSSRRSHRFHHQRAGNTKAGVLAVATGARRCCAFSGCIIRLFKPRAVLFADHEEPGQAHWYTRAPQSAAGPTGCAGTTFTVYDNIQIHQRTSWWRQFWARAEHDRALRRHDGLRHKVVQMERADRAP